MLYVEGWVYMRFFLFLVIGGLALGQSAQDVSTNVQLENLVFYMDQHGDATKIGTLAGPVPLDPQLGTALAIDEPSAAFLPAQRPEIAEELMKTPFKKQALAAMAHARRRRHSGC